MAEHCLISVHGVCRVTFFSYIIFIAVVLLGIGVCKWSSRASLDGRDGPSQESAPPPDKNDGVPSVNSWVLEVPLTIEGHGDMSGAQASVA